MDGGGKGVRRERTSESQRTDDKEAGIGDIIPMRSSGHGGREISKPEPSLGLRVTSTPLVQQFIVINEVQ